jgi:hypothetical protein
MTKTVDTKLIGLAWIAVFIGCFIARNVYSWEVSLDASEDVRSLLHAPYPLKLRNSVFEYAMLASVWGFMFTVVEMPRGPAVFFAGLIIASLSQFLFIEEKARAYEDTHTFKRGVFNTVMKSEKPGHVFWDKTVDEELIETTKEALTFIATIPYRLLDSKASGYPSIIERVNEEIRQAKESAQYKQDKRGR